MATHARLDVAAAGRAVVRLDRRARSSGRLECLGVLGSARCLRRRVELGRQADRFAPFEGTRYGRWVAAAWGVGELAVVIAAVLLHKNGSGPWVLVAAGAILYASVVMLGPLTERRIGVPTRPLS